MKPLHEELKDLRLEKGVGLNDIYMVTKIRPSLLEKLEEGDFSIVPEPFLRAFLREYAEVTGIDPERVILRYENKVESIRETDRTDDDLPESISRMPEANLNTNIPENIFSEKGYDKISPQEGQIPQIELLRTAIDTSETPVNVTVELVEPSQPLKMAFIDDEKPDIPVEDEKAVHTYSRSSIDIKEPSSSQGLFFGIFIFIIIITALAIIYINS